jgi:putative transposon-encoded protein
MLDEENLVRYEEGERDSTAEMPPGKVKFVVYGEEMVEKLVRQSGNSGRVYLPPDWVGHRVKIIRID